MFKMLHCIHELAGAQRKKLIVPIILSIIDSLLNSSMYGIMLYLLLDLSKKQFTNERLKLYTILLIVIFVMRCLMQMISFTGTQCTGSEVTYRLRLQIANHLRQLPLGFFNKNSIGRLSSVLMNDVDDFQTILTHCLCDFIKVIFFTLISLVFAYYIHFIFGLILTVFVVIAFPLLMLSGKISTQKTTEWKDAHQNATSHLVEYINGMKTFRLYHLIGSHFQRLDQSLLALKQASIHREIAILPVAMCFSTFISFMVPVSLILGTYFLVNQTLDQVYFFIVILLAVSVSNILSVLGSLYPQIRAVLQASENILAVLHEKTLPYQKENIELKNFDIEFLHVTFQYQNHISVLKDLSFQAKQNTTTALIGPSGSGKTTIVSLLARFWDVQEGEITIGGEKIKDISPDNLTQYMAIVFQDVYLLNDTVFNNIRLSCPQASDKDVVRVAKAACCHEFIMNMENGYDTVIGEGGSTLSGGEKQRIAIARALLKDAPIVLLDETTSSLDADNEYEIQKAMQRLMKNKTVLVIAHRLQTIIDADHIIVLDDGKIKEEGNHCQLLKQDGWYAKMYRAQQKAQSWKIQK